MIKKTFQKQSQKKGLTGLLGGFILSLFLLAACENGPKMLDSTDYKFDFDKASLYQRDPIRILRTDQNSKGSLQKGAYRFTDGRLTALFSVGDNGDIRDTLRITFNEDPDFANNKIEVLVEKGLAQQAKIFQDSILRTELSFGKKALKRSDYNLSTGKLAREDSLHYGKNSEAFFTIYYTDAGQKDYAVEVETGIQTDYDERGFVQSRFLKVKEDLAYQEVYKNETLFKRWYGKDFNEDKRIVLDSTSVIHFENGQVKDSTVYLLRDDWVAYNKEGEVIDANINIPPPPPLPIEPIKIVDDDDDDIIVEGEGVRPKIQVMELPPVQKLSEEDDQP